ncbi:Pr6Pr family membrane protein [uncultured Microbacterium sp.]|uniref:Pr6Pr family membrane protein n=1 Tax=uncultured Microbacterium sp. TaxID=191216 RepID=UPI0035C9A6C4
MLVVGNVNVDFGPSNAPLSQRLFEFVSYFTVQSNIFVGLAAGVLTARPDRDGGFFRVLRVGSMFGITVTLIMYHLALRPLANFTGIAATSNIGLHYVVPAFTIIGWVLFRPDLHVTWKALFLALIWPLAYILLTVASNGAGITLLLLAVGAVYKLADRLISRRYSTMTSAVPHGAPACHSHQNLDDARAGQQYRDLSHTP